MAKNESQLAHRMAANVAEATARVPEQKKTLEGLFLSRREAFEQALARTMPFDRFLRVLITRVSGNPQLLSVAKANPGSLIAACMEMAQTGLDPAIPNECHLVPYGDKIVHQVGYKGLAKMAMEAAKQFSYPLEVLNSEVIFENDQFERSMGSNPIVVHKMPPLGQPRGKPIGFVATSKDCNGMINAVVMSWEEMRAHYQRFCKAKNNPKSMWYNCFSDPARTDDNSHQYGLKTVTRLLINRYLPMSTKLADVITADDSESYAPIVSQATSPIEPEPSENETIPPVAETVPPLPETKAAPSETTVHAHAMPNI